MHWQGIFLFRSYVHILVQIMETMDKMCFSLAINEIESVVSSPTAMMNWKKLVDALSFLIELMHVLVSHIENKPCNSIPPYCMLLICTFAYNLE